MNSIASHVINEYFPGAISSGSDTKTVATLRKLVKGFEADMMDCINEQAAEELQLGIAFFEMIANRIETGKY